MDAATGLWSGLVSAFNDTDTWLQLHAIRLPKNMLLCCSSELKRTQAQMKEEAVKQEAVSNFHSKQGVQTELHLSPKWAWGGGKGGKKRDGDIGLSYRHS